MAAQYPRKIERLIAELCKLPGIGRKSAQQLAFHILSLDEKEADDFADAIKDAKHSVRYCPICGTEAFTK